MSVASDEWKALFDKPPEEAGWHKFIDKHPNLKSKINWEGSWQAWENARTATKDPSKGWAKEQPEANDKAKAIALQPFLNATAEEAVLLHRQATTEGTEGQTTISAAIKEMIAGTLCGQDIERQGPTMDCKDTAGGGNKESTCATAQNGKGVMHDLLCLCHTSGGDECTGSAVAELTAATTAFVAKAVSKLKELCGKPTTAGDPAIDLQLALTHFASRLGTGQKVGPTIKMVLGTTKTGTDCGSRNSACIDYTARYDEANAGYASIKWVQAMQQALTLAQKRKQHEHTRDEAARALKELRNTVSREFKRPTPTTTAIAQTKKTDTDTKNEQHNNCKTKNSTAADCPPDLCNCNKQTKECEP
ncbi:Trypanosomal VSG domain containing protein, putative [Trypanosoma equiperdum]|uniref:Trypanosomal VSG domain containing protein, putative n=1 Tax=Trypanosoma equiperdum TaxID=5694 RepID=A0A1G4I6W6_TRYEQ|nr:Trypanosomal VSG domain containing protein, putative [Trypanosoma equiperdum]